MKKLITICLIMAATFTTQAQNKELNKEETLEYMNKIKSANTEKFSVNANIFEKTYFSPMQEANFRIELNPYKSSNIKEVGDGYFMVWYDNTKVEIFHIKSEAERFKKAFDHLLELIKNDKSDPFGN